MLLIHTMLQGEIIEGEENVDGKTGKGDFLSTLKYFPDVKHNGQQIKCIAEHQGYTSQQIEQKANEVQKQLELFCKPY